MAETKRGSRNGGTEARPPEQGEQRMPTRAEPRSGTVAPYTGFQQFAQYLQQGFNQMLNELFGPEPARGWEPVRWPAFGGWGLDVDDRDDAVIVRAEAPGFEPEDFDLQVRGQQLIVRATRKTDSAEDGGARRWGRRELYHTVTLPAGIDENKVEARYRHGVLTVTLPKTEEGKGRRITVQE